MSILLVFLIFILIPVLSVLWITRDHFSLGRHFLRRGLRVGVPIIYRMVESSTRPDPEAWDVHPAPRGDFYYYLMSKYWRIEKVQADGWIVAVTPLMEHHYLRWDDPNLRKANFLERLRYAARFPSLP